MNTTSPSTEKILVWDAPVRVFHWLLVLSFAGAYLSAESERWRLLHVSLGYTVRALVAFRLVWGLIGTRHARFASFVRGPRAVLRYLRSLVSGQPEHHVGHNPAGALAIMLLLGLGALLAGTGWAVYNDVGGHLVEELHEGVAKLMLALALVHVVAVGLSSWLHRENLVRAMLNGKKVGTPVQAIQRRGRSLALLLLLAVLGFWWLQWHNAPTRHPRAPSDSATHAQSSQDEHPDD